MYYDELRTDPRNHDPNNFVYLVHGLISLDPFQREITPEFIKEKLNRLKDNNEFYRASLIGKLDKETARKKLSWYGGEISQLETFGNSGLILNPGGYSLQVAWNSDIGSPWDQEELKKWVYAHPNRVKNAFDLLIKTKGPKNTKYNELIFRGNPETKIEGIWFRENKENIKLLKDIISEETQTELPIIELPPITFEYENIKDPKEKELARSCAFLSANFELMESQAEFQEPHKFRNGMDIYYCKEEIPRNLELDLEVYKKPF